MKGIEKAKIPQFINYLISEGFEVIAPVKTKDGINFETVKNGHEMTTEYINTVYSPKRFFFPDGKVLFKYDLNEEPKIIENKEKVKRIIFGIRPCDLHGLLILDKVLKKDPYYMQKRKNTILIAVNCSKSGENCFCEFMGTNKVEHGYDMLLSESDEFYIVNGCSLKGKRFLGFFKQINKKIGQNKVSNTRKFDLKNVENNILKIFNHTRWKNIADRCLSCGACTVVCPTCYCFSINDEPDFDKKTGERKRFWSFCMLMEFSRVAGNVVFRRDRIDRCRQFVFHKLSYFKNEHGKHLCVGCGRCIEICPAKIDFFKEVEKMIK